MSNLPNTREKREYNWSGEDIGENPYYEGNLNVENKIIMRIYDFGVDNALNAFDNLADMIDEEELSTDETYHLVKVLEDEKIMELLKNTLKKLIGYSRHDYVVSLIENQGEK